MVIPIVPEVYSSKVQVPVVVNPPAVIVPVVVSLASFFKKASSTAITESVAVKLEPANKVAKDAKILAVTLAF